MRFHFNWFLILALVACPTAWGQAEGGAKQDQAAETQDDEKELTVAEKFRELQMAQRRMMMERSQQLRQAETPEDRSDITKKFSEVESELIQKAFALVDESDDDNTSVSILVWLSGAPGEAQTKATKLLMNKYIDSPAIGPLAGRLARGRPSPQTEAMLQAILEKNKDPQVQGQATMAMAQYLGNMKRYVDLDEAERKQMAARMGLDAEYLAKWTPKTIDEARMKLLETCVEKYGDISMGRKTIGQIAEGQLFVLKYLQIGKVAPDIEGADLDEVAFKLSDYRGKVVVLDFWGDW